MTVRQQDLWDVFIKPASIIIAIIIFVFIFQSIFNFSDNVRWIIISVASVLWLIYYYVFEFPYSEKDELPDEV